MSLGKPGEETELVLPGWSITFPIPGPKSSIKIGAHEFTIQKPSWAITVEYENKNRKKVKRYFMVG